MTQMTLYHEVFKKLYEGLRIENHDKFFNTEEKKEYEVNNLYPDIILTKKGSSEVSFIIEILQPLQGQIDYILSHVKPMSNIGGVFYLLVPKNEKNQIEKICRENEIHPRFGIYYKSGNELKIMFE